MSELTIFYMDEDKENIKYALQRLFLLQDKPAGEQKLNVFLEEILQFNYPIKAILKGLKELQNESIQQIKLGTIKEFIEKNIDYSFSNESEYCEHCKGSGFISMHDIVHGYAFSFACICKNGDNHTRKVKDYIPLAKWNGQEQQTFDYNGKYSGRRNFICRKE